MTGRNVVPFQAPGSGEPVAPPHNTEAERSLLGALLLKNDSLMEVGPLLKPEHFYWADHQEVYACICQLIAKGLPADPITVKGYLPYPEIDGVPVMRFLAAICAEATSLNAAGYAEIVRAFAARRELLKIGTDLIQRAQTSSAETSGQDLIEATEAQLLDARAVGPQDHLSGMAAADAGSWMLERIEALRSGDEATTTVPTGISQLDFATGGGFPSGQLWMIGARPGVGKTVVMTSLSRLAARDTGVLVFQLEVTRDQQMARYFADMAYSANRPLTFGQIMKATDLTNEDMWRLEDAGKRFAKLDLRLECQPGISIAQIVFAVRAEKKRLAKQGKRLGVVFIDYLKFIKATDRYKSQRVLEIGEISGALKILAKEEDLCVVLLVQLNRGLEGRDDRRPTLADLRDSGELEQDADTVIFLYRDAYYLEKNPKLKHDAELQGRLIDKQNSMEMILGKNRAGPTATLDLWCDVAASSVASHARGF